MPNNLPCILLVDDQPSNLYLLEELLQSEGYATLSAESGAQALAVAKESPPALILLDVMMPDLDGFEVCRRLREDAILMAVPVIFLTALEDEDSRIKGLEMMGDAYLTKPVKSNLLLAKIASTLRLRAMREQHLQLQLSQQLQEKNKRNLSAAWQINQALTEKFRLFVPEQFLQRIAPAGVESIQLGNAKEEEISILFCDIRGFTAIAESQDAADTFKWLNAFFTQMNQAIASQHGFIDKFLGDAIMAVFDRQGHHAQDALTAAVMMRQSLREFNDSRVLFNLQVPVNIGIGIHTGRGLIGTLGSNSRMDSTVIGDVVNTASRLEELTKVYGCGVIVSEAVVSRLTNPSLFDLRFLDRVTPRGKQQALDIYEAICAQTCVFNESGDAAGF
ncbi:MAG: response regulator [Oscillatoria princeps RMCB-10]|jgi:two-component system sensor histidine kinase ChiS|nr:response regulator [Oscillatoria princeps RMCB-10]